MTADDLELAQLLAPSTFSLDECRARSREARTPEELKLILIGEECVKKARAKRNRFPKSAADPSSLALRIQQGKQAAERLRASASEHKNLRKLWERSSSGSAGSAADWCLKSLASPNCSPVGDKKQNKPQLVSKSVKSFNERYSMISVRSTASSVDAPVQNSERVKQSGAYVPTSSPGTLRPVASKSTPATTFVDCL